MSRYKPVILASQSEQRQQLFTALNIPFSIEPADIDELKVDHPDHVVRASLVAEAKGVKISQLHPEAIVISADTFVVLDEKRLEKPLSKQEAIEMLLKQSGQHFISHTGWSYIDPSLSIREKGTVSTEVTFRSLSLTEVEYYVQTQPVTKWAGAFSIMKPSSTALIESVQGSITGLMGLPIEALIPLLKQSRLL